MGFKAESAPKGFKRLYVINVVVIILAPVLTHFLLIQLEAPFYPPSEQRVSIISCLLDILFVPITWETFLILNIWGFANYKKRRTTYLIIAGLSTLIVILRLFMYFTLSNLFDGLEFMD